MGLWSFHPWISGFSPRLWHSLDYGTLNLDYKTLRPDYETLNPGLWGSLGVWIPNLRLWASNLKL